MDKTVDKNSVNPWYAWVCGCFVHFGQIGQIHELLGLKPLVLLVFCVKSRKFHKVGPSSVYLKTSKTLKFGVTSPVVEIQK